MVDGTLWDSCELMVAGHHHDLKCDRRGFHIELIHHVLWICPIARVVFEKSVEKFVSCLR